MKEESRILTFGSEMYNGIWICRLSSGPVGALWKCVSQIKPDIERSEMWGVMMCIIICLVLQRQLDGRRLGTNDIFHRSDSLGDAEMTFTGDLATQRRLGKHSRQEQHISGQLFLRNMEPEYSMLC